MIYNKLVRDKIPEIIAESGKVAIYRRLDDEEYKIELEKKLDEEVAEFHESKSIEELADIYLVLAHLCIASGHSLEDLVLHFEQKLKERGGFCYKIFLKEVRGND